MVSFLSQMKMKSNSNFDKKQILKKDFLFVKINHCRHIGAKHLSDVSFVIETAIHKLLCVKAFRKKTSITSYRVICYSLTENRYRIG